jgi:hypothetical protein
MAKKRSNKSLKYSIIAISAVILIFLVLVIVKSPTTTNPNGSDGIASKSLVNQLVSLENKVIQSVGLGTATAQPKSISGPDLTVNGKPQVVYLGAEYCPYCAAERWPMTIALTRFGSFKNLATTHSSASDSFPDTQTFSYHGSSYSSPYLIFSPVEMYSNIPNGTGYAVLDKPSSQQQNLMNTYDAPPYVPSANAGAIPFIYFGGKYIITGASFSPTVLQNKTYAQIVSALVTNPKDPISQGILGATNLITASICAITNNQPSNVCTSTIQAIVNKLSK